MSGGATSATPPVRAILGQATSTVVGWLGRYGAILLIVQGGVLLIGAPVVAVLLGVLLNVAGERTPATVDVLDLLRDPLAVALLVAVLLVIGLLALVELAVLLLVADRYQDGRRVSLVLVARDLGAVIRRLARPSALLLVPYLLLLVPASGFVFGGVFTSGLRVPAAIRTELVSTAPGTIAYFGLAVAVVYLNLRLALTLPLLVTRERGVAEAIRSSWRRTRRQSFRILLVVAAIGGTAIVVAVGLAVLGLGPTRLADDLAPDWSPMVAVVSLTLIELVLFLVAGYALALLANAAVAVLRDRPPATAPVRHRPSVLLATAVTAAAAALVGALLPSNAGTIATVSSGENTLVIAHRSLESGGVENTLAALRAAAAFRPDYLEIDVQQAADGSLVVFHDATLDRLAGDPRRIADLTLAELRRVPLRQNGEEARIPTLEQYLARAQQLGQRLLIELKVNGGESDEYVPDVLAALAAFPMPEPHLVASFDKELIEEFAELEPAIPAGYIVRVNLGLVPETSADFLVVNYSAYSRELRDEARDAGIELMVWTVDDTRAIRELLRDSVDGIITNRGRAARAEQQQIVYETGIASRLEDVLRRTFGI